MIIDYTQEKDGVKTSYVNDLNQIVVETIPVKNGFYRYVATNEFDKDKLPNLRSFKHNSPIKKEPTKYFTNHNVNEFFTKDIMIDYPEIFDKISKLNIPNPYSCDIETEITDEFGYSTPEKAENRILSISITDDKLNSIIFCIKNPEQPQFTDIDKLEIQSLITDSLGAEYAKKFNYNFDIRVFDTEAEMLAVFIECINKYFHVIVGWNFTLFDWIWIENRCAKLNIDIRKASPTFKINTNKYKSKKQKKRADEDVPVIITHTPTHRIIADYMKMFQEALIYNNLESYSLNSIASLVLKLNKVMYDGNLRTLYNQNYNKFIGYALMDTILVMLIHKATNLYNIDFFEAYYNSIAYSKISQNTISEALVYNELKSDNIFLLESEFNVEVKRKYQGGFVKVPTKKIIEAGAGLDYSGLYPNCINTIGISPDRLVDRINTIDGFPANAVELKKWLTYKEQNCTLSPMGRIYDKNSDGVFVRIEKKLIAQRKIFKGHVEDIYLNILPDLEKRLKQMA